MKTIEIIVSPTGESQIEAKGFAGNECREATKFIESALGAVSNETLKAEFHVQYSTQNSIQNSN